LDYSEKLIVFVPFMTTIDTCLINFVSKTKPKEINELFQRTPIIFIPMVSDGKLVICDVVPNKENTPGNSVFGPKGVICPGNLITSAMVKAMMDLMNHFDYTIEGSPIFSTNSFINIVLNKDDIKIVL